MKYNIIFLLLFITTFSFAQDKGIQFEHGTWKEAVAKAKKENKMIYVDFFTTWCGPCKLMASKHFPNEKAGAKYNSLFINFKIDAESKEGILLSKKYDVADYPTNLFIDCKTEKVVYKTTGCPIELSGFLKNADVAIIEKNDPLTIEQYKLKFSSKKYDEIFLKKLIEKNNRIGNLNDEYVDAYLSEFGNRMSDSEKYIFISENSEFLTANIKAFYFLLSLKDKNTFSNERLESVIRTMVYNCVENAEKNNSEREMLIAKEKMTKYYQDGYDYMFDNLKDFYTKNKNNIKLVSLYDEYGKYFSTINDKDIERRNKEAYDHNVIVQTQLMQFQGGIDTLKVDSIVRHKLLENGRDKIISNSTASNLNTICWDIFEKMPSNKSLVTKSLVWIQRAMQLTENDATEWCPIADTYAHLLQLTGNKKEAINITKQVIEKATQLKLEDIDSFKKYLSELEK